MFTDKDRSRKSWRQSVRRLKQAKKRLGRYMNRYRLADLDKQQKKNLQEQISDTECLIKTLMLQVEKKDPRTRV